VSISKIETNLYSLYTKMATFTEHPIQEEHGVSWVNCPPHKWPYTLFDFPKMDLDFTNLVEKIKSGHIPPHWIMRQKEMPTFQQQLKENGFRLMRQWPGMAIDLSRHHFEKTSAQKVTNLKELKGWLNVINQTLFSPSPMHEDFIKTVFEKDDSSRLYIHKEDDQVISIGMSHDTEDTTGFYMIATLESKRGKGYGTAITQQMLFDAKERKLKTATLQATPMGAKIYTKLGFEQFCIFDIYWLLGVR